MGLNLGLPAVFWFTNPSNLPAYNNNNKNKGDGPRKSAEDVIGGNTTTAIFYNTAYNILILFDIISIFQ